MQKYSRLGLAALLLSSASLSFAQIPITNIINTFDAAGSYGGGIGREWGPSSAAWDGVEGIPVGAELITTVWDPTSDTPLTAFACKGDGANPWSTPFPISFSLYDTLEFDIKYDPTSDITIDQFNNVLTWPLSLTNNASANQSVFQSWAGAGQIGADGFIGGLEIQLCGGPGGQMAPFIINTNIPAAAASGWAHVKIPINKAQAQIDGVSGIVFHGWCKNTWTLLTPVTARFWIDNVQLIGTTAPPAPPTVKLPTKATQGLNVFASTGGLYDRQSAVLRQTAGLSWVGQATIANPVTYSFTIAGYPTSVNCEAWVFLVPSPTAAYVEGAPDWNATNCVKLRLQGSLDNATMQFQYKVNEDNNQAMYGGGNETRGYYTNAPGSWDGVTPNYLESGYLGSVANNTILGTWTIKFTSDTNVTLIAPNGSTTNFIFPTYNVGYFAEQADPAFRAYLGMQANNADAMNQAVVYSDFAITGTATPFSENFLTDTVLDTTNIWNTGAASGPAGVLVVPAGSASWVNWTLPDTGFSLQAAPSLTGTWTDPSTGPIIPINAARAQLLANSEVPVGGSAFYRLIKRVATKLQVLLPGETNAPNTPTGKTGSPTPIAASGVVSVTVNQVDDTWHIVSSTDTINVLSTDGTATVPLDKALVNGTQTWDIQFNTAGSYTVTATNVTTITITPNTSSPLTVN